MLQSIRALTTSRCTAIAAFVLALASAWPLAVVRAGGQAEAADRVFDVVKRFDFDERPLGNYEPTPTNWERLPGSKFPAYSDGRLDDGFGRQAPPAFRLDVQGGNVCYEYCGTDVPVSRDAEYLVVAYVRAIGLRHARACLHAFLVDEDGERVPDSDRVSALVRSLNAGPDASARTDAPDATGDAGEPWQRIETTISGDFPTAQTMRLGVWVVQPDLWDHAGAEPDPIFHQDVRATVWVDDVAVYRLPRVSLRLSNPAGIVRPGESAELTLDVHNSWTRPLATELKVLDASGRVRLHKRQELAAQASNAVRVPIPELEPGLYATELYLCGEDQEVRYRATRFAVLPELPEAGALRGDLGVDLGRWQGGDARAVAELLQELRCGTAKVGLPLMSEVDEDAAVSYLDGIRGLARTLRASRIAPVGVMLPPDTTAGDGAERSVRAVLGDRRNLEGWLGPVMAYLGGAIGTWQLGDERIECATPGTWEAETVVAVRALLAKFLSAPEVVVPWSALDGGSGGAGPVADDGQTLSVWVPGDVPTRALPEQIAALVTTSEDDPQETAAAQSAARRWLTLDESGAGLASAQRQADFARRLVLAKAFGAERMYTRAPFEACGEGVSGWQPTDEFIPFRTLAHYLTGKRAVAAMPLPKQDGLIVIFSGVESDCAAVWTWRDEASREPAELYLGADPEAVDLMGRRQSLAVRDGRAQVLPTPTPVILDHIDARVACLEATLRIEPNCVEPDDLRTPPVLRFRNPYSAALVGKLHVSLPPNWRLPTPTIPFEVPQGEVLAQPLMLELPPCELALERRIGVRVELTSPVGRSLEFSVPIGVALRDIRTEVRTHWTGDDLIVEQSVQNLSEEAVSFGAFCRAPQRAEAEGAFLNVRPGERFTETYVYPDARDLRGAVLRLGLREIRGRRCLDQLVEAGG